MMLDAVLVFGVLCACAAFGYGRVKTLAELVTDPRRRTPLALLLSAALSLSLIVFEVPFILPLWWGIDAAVIAAIRWPHWHSRDWSKWRQAWPILILFAPIWVAYLVPSQAGYEAIVLLVALQMVLTLPIKRLWRRALRTRAPDAHPFDDFDLRVAHNGHFT